jgi:signal transduction histidine kinase
LISSGLEMAQIDHDRLATVVANATLRCEGLGAGKRKLLFIDDDPYVIASLKMLFGRDFHTYDAANADDGIQLFKNLHPDVVLLDLRLPGKDGIAILKAIRTLDQITPVVIVTGFATQATAEECRRLGAVDYVDKPFNAVYLKDRVSELATRYPPTPQADADLAFADSLRRLNELELTENASSSFLHDVANPLTGLITLCDMLRDNLKHHGTVPPELLADSLEIISDNSHYMAALVEHWRAFSEPQTLNLEQVPLKSVLDLTLGLVKGRAADRNIRIDVKHGSTSSQLRTNRFALARVLANLIQNAIEAVTPGSGVVEISTSCEEEILKIVVCDNGPGIPPSIAERVFEPRMTTKSRSMGLGLYISKKIIQSSGGDLTFRNHPQGGAEFTLTMTTSPS